MPAPTEHYCFANQIKNIEEDPACSQMIQDMCGCTHANQDTTAAAQATNCPWNEPIILFNIGPTPWPPICSMRGNLEGATNLWGRTWYIKSKYLTIRLLYIFDTTYDLDHTFRDTISYQLA